MTATGGTVSPQVGDIFDNNVKHLPITAAKKTEWKGDFEAKGVSFGE